MANPHHHCTHGQDIPLVTPLALMLDIRLTPLERNGWQVLRMLRTADGLSPLANMGQLRRYLTSTAMGQRAGYETARRVLVVLRLTGWISLVGQHRDPMTGHVLSELYLTHEKAQTFEQACEIDASLPQLLRESLGHTNNPVGRVAVHIQKALTKAPTTAPTDAKDQRDDDEPPTPSGQGITPTPPPGDSISETPVVPQTEPTRQTIREPDDSTYKYSYKERTYRARAHEEDGSAAPPVPLPPCLESAKADQQKDVQAALRRLPPQDRQAVLDELQARSQSGTVRNVIAYFFSLVKRALAGEFRLWAGREVEQSVSTPQRAQQAQPDPTTMPLRIEAQSKLAPKPASPETAKMYLADIRKALGKSVHAEDLAAQLTQADRWRSRPA